MQFQFDKDNLTMGSLKINCLESDLIVRKKELQFSGSFRRIVVIADKLK